MCYILNVIFAITGYYAYGPDVTLAAICRPLEGDDKPHIINIASSNLRLRWERVRHLRRIINLIKIIESIQSVIGVRGDPEFIPIIRDDRTIQVCGKGVPNVDHLEFYKKAEGKVYNTPKGQPNVSPKNQQELIEAIICVLEAFVVSMVAINF
ncbi:hypothetical protein RclHR1_00580028 [Rhizophagus clarus]|uniref:Uncharacterized protein n=1 Tax=Rhizophagus clarus TaxID=94130 RepID=A0A2Z6RUY4_9GLOM|nr:hypothetical protein RclHR1_00580028 [Rhizophagus clarus]